MNPYSTIQFALTKSNGDVSFLQSRNTEYVTKYATKAQDTIDSIAIAERHMTALSRAIRNREAVEQAAGTSVSVSQAARGRLFSFLWHLTNMVEIMTTMASLYILRNESPMYQSHPNTALTLISAIAAVEGSEQVRTYALTTISSLCEHMK
jgi:hypothetical protein